MQSSFLFSQCCKEAKEGNVVYIAMKVILFLFRIISDTVHPIDTLYHGDR
jgi:hypothetical protein